GVTHSRLVEDVVGSGSLSSACQPYHAAPAISTRSTASVIGTRARCRTARQSPRGSSRSSAYPSSTSPVDGSVWSSRLGGSSDTLTSAHSTVEMEDPGVHDHPLLQGRAQCAVQAVLEIELLAPLHDVGEQVAVVRRILGEQGFQVEGALGR